MGGDLPGKDAHTLNINMLMSFCVASNIWATLLELDCFENID